mmetsp:Transcript_14112/g.12461  ORF Transcript_14112/g.12461 Transcript_14112/m.12461 type:complete len:126 (+) Transcript_14112:687-1064(+)
MRDKVRNNLKAKDDLNLNVLITTIKDFNGQVVGHSKEKMREGIPEKMKDHFIAAFLVWSTKRSKEYYVDHKSGSNQGWLQGKPLDLINMDMDDQTLLNLNNVDIDKLKLADTLTALDLLISSSYK